MKRVNTISLARKLGLKNIEVDLVRQTSVLSLAKLWKKAGWSLQDIKYCLLERMVFVLDAMDI